ncbi:hypothetical protein SynPROS91_02377 [Synechococcus sp. PROS-9-1]|nr:hypothetical protein SynPROS91_02377 [Synechococcus sp. PROS-9-1]
MCAELSPFGPVYRALKADRFHDQTGAGNCSQTLPYPPNGCPLWSAVSPGQA